MSETPASDQEILTLIDEPGIPMIHDQGETEDDLTSRNPADFQGSISSTDWTVETIVNQMRKGRIDLDPQFQRRNAWLSSRKSQLVESIMLRYPIPQIVLAERQDSPGHYIVIDGKQRLLALRQFCFDEGDSRDTQFDALKLGGLDVLEGINGMTWPQIEKTEIELAAKFENHTIRTVFLSNWKNDELLLSLFLRLNTGSVALSPQELRQALIPGLFVEWIDFNSGESPGLQYLLGNAQPDRRMIDAELLLRFISLTQSPVEYKGNLKKFLDDTCRAFNNDWAVREITVRESLESLEAAIAATKTVFPEGAVCRKWSRSRFERPFNRALFDAQAIAFADPEVRRNLPGNEDALLEGFKKLCDGSEKFRQSISSTTKTADSFKIRIESFRNLVNDILGVKFDLPRALYPNQEGGK